MQFKLTSEKNDENKYNQFVLFSRRNILIFFREQKWIWSMENINPETLIKGLDPGMDFYSCWLGSRVGNLHN